MKGSRIGNRVNFSDLSVIDFGDRGSHVGHTKPEMPATSSRATSPPPCLWAMMDFGTNQVSSDVVVNGVTFGYQIGTTGTFNTYLNVTIADPSENGANYGDGAPAGWDSGYAEITEFGCGGGEDFLTAALELVDTTSTSPAPEPASFALAGGGLVLAGLLRRRIKTRIGR